MPAIVDTHDRTRGNTADRRARKLWMLERFGDGQKCDCAHCGCELTYDTVQADRILPGLFGGTYRRSNLQPSCARCNAQRKADVNWQPVLHAA